MIAVPLMTFTTPHPSLVPVKQVRAPIFLQFATTRSDRSSCWGSLSLATLFRSLHCCLLDNFREDVEWILDTSFQFSFQLSSANSKPFKMIFGGEGPFLAEINA